MSPLSRDQQLLSRLCAERQELPWLEFKENLREPREIGEYISALSNSAVLSGVTHGYLVWGVRDGDHGIVGTRFEHEIAKGAGNEDLLPWLTRLLSPQVYFEFRTIETGVGIRVVILEVAAARATPTAFSGDRYVRVGSYKKRLPEYPEYESRLWELLRGTGFEAGIARANLTESALLEQLDYPALFDLLQLPLPETRRGIVESLVREGLAGRGAAGDLYITNLGALLLAREMVAFPTVSRKTIRVVQYDGSSRAGGNEIQAGSRGYAGGFSGLQDYLHARLPSAEIVESGLRRHQQVYPQRAIRELVANMLIHQDLSVGGSGPMVEIFSNRIEFTNPGVPLIDVRRFIGQRPPSRNEALALFMTRVGISEERGSGWEKIAAEVELHQLPAPRITVESDHTKVTLFAPRPFSEMSKTERSEAVYLHTVLRFVSSEATTNTSIRARFGIAEQNSAQASRLLTDAMDAGLILIEDVSVGTRLRRYVPFWSVAEVA